MSHDLEFARQMVERLETVLRESAGLQSVTISGQVVSFEKAQAQYEYWSKRKQQLEGKRPRMLTVELEGGV